MLYEAIRARSSAYHSSEGCKDYNLWYTLYFGLFKNPSKWNDKDTLDIQEVNRLIRYFLNKWDCRFAYKLEPELLAVLKRTVPIVKPLENMTILTIQSDADFDRIAQAYNILTSVNGINDTIASKILHTINRELFPMRDFAMNRWMYSWSPYSPNFCKEMQDLAECAIGQIQTNEKDNACRTDAINSLRGKNCSHTLAKVLDEYNFVTAR